MYKQVVNMFEVGASPSTVQNTLRVKFAKQPAKLLEVPGRPVFRNLLRTLGMSCGELRSFVDLHDFDRYINSRDSTLPPLGLLPGGTEGGHAHCGHELITFNEFGNDQCITFFTERIMVTTLVECVKACWDPKYHVGNPEVGHWLHRKYGVVLSCDDTCKISYEGGWELTATVVVVTYLYDDTIRKRRQNCGVSHKAQVLMFQYQKASSKETLSKYMMGAIHHVVSTLAQLPSDHTSGLGNLLPIEWNTLHIATGCGDNADQVVYMFNAEQTNTVECVISMTRPTDDDFQTLFLTCWPHLAFALNKRAYAGDTPEKKDVAKLLMEEVVRCIYYSKTGEERDSLQDLVRVTCEISGNSGNGKWFLNEYQTSPHSCWQYSASQLPGAMGDDNPLERFWRSFKAVFMDSCRCGHKALLHEVFPRAVTNMWPRCMGAPLRQCLHLQKDQYAQVHNRLCGTEVPILQNAFRPEEFFINSGVLLSLIQRLYPELHRLYPRVTDCTPT